MTQSPTPPRPAAETRRTLADEITALRNRVDVLADIDRQTSEMVMRLADAVRSTAEVRAHANLEIKESLGRIEATLSHQRLRRRELMAALQRDILATHGRASRLAGDIAALERSYDVLQQRLTVVNFDVTNSDDDSTRPNARSVARTEPVTEPRPWESSEPAAMAPRPAASSVMLDVERVPSAGAALSIQRFVSSLPGVVAATTREYAAGHLRLEVRVRGGLEAKEFGRWPDGRLEVLATAPDSMELRVVA